ncbi:30S ribosomal protein S8 [Candidatus Desantisbacteria bacterium CG_4_9_14_3_um_filter_40_11]|uniref:Small ribosomal subunit protein uS8 n=5 Tax=unclassified Candidatus Desantisiibacteriota TaxID=3106372 RepID=A0A2M7JF62_9BACT|nr:MAG: 30S ribosomal protein S8 [Candidatus Desantisbacteria bacterium CG23_combo_of_CG06-09_8_20_14_all_40_23]PIX18000.1 MAG: 30S ribosomal protein S8 [Candidatus Desantisbacteria bacterium CG_4_8_14_3_um_filter_40_12]PIY19556.1 MAG: 30S ribosomal protein S8 [Candidatus Desantisbacteria bacterium CG_4_10_14_3_um_filter_40_18]PJB30203.1 MAG: 30S ribosomal protein S8 [Candidatus Desantisbacteria bacterium CG_4_9_14_3_um_filter_40_11]
MLTDPIADMLTRIRNANKAGHEKLDMPASNLKTQVISLLKRERYIKNYKLIEDRKQGILRVYLRYGPNNEKIITNLKRISKPGLRRYKGSENVSRVFNGLGVAIVSTSKGILTDKECRKMNVGGEILCEVW